MNPPTLPYSQAQGELAYCPDDFSGACSPDPMEPELPAMIEANLVADNSAAGVYGPMTRPASSRWTEEYDRRFGIGYMMLDESRASAYGPMLRAVVPIGCDTTVGVIREGDFQGVTTVGTRIAESAELDPHLQSPGSSYGPAVLFHGHGRCYNVQGIRPDGENTYRDDLYITDVFGLSCVFCPTMFATFERPCFGCSYPQHDRVVLGAPVDLVCPGSPPHVSSYYDGCAQQTVDVGDAVCVPWAPPGDLDYDPNWHVGCHFTDSQPDEHHCEDCVFQRNLGFLVNQILAATDTLSRIPMRPSLSKDLGSCAYGCGEFGWNLWSATTDGRLRVPDYLDANEDLKAKEWPCESPNCVNINGWHESGHIACGVGPGCDCTGDGVWCTSTHSFRWRKEDPRNAITSCSVCFSQRELCDPINGPCDSNPFADLEDYHSPSSEIIVDVEAHVKITLVFDHWGPISGPGGCECCAAMGFDSPPKTITVNIRGDFCGPLPFGNRDTFPGYMPVAGRMYPGRQDPLTGGQIESPAGTYPRGSCANFFVDQGLYTDDPFQEPPKRCPSWVGDESGRSAAQFWCPPRVRWTWDIQGGGTRWVPPSWPHNKHQTANQCWAAQLAKNLGGCSDGSIMWDVNDVRPCDDPNCRRGCWVHEDLDAQGAPMDPCDPLTPQAVPWGCEQCQV